MRSLKQLKQWLRKKSITKKLLTIFVISILTTQVAIANDCSQVVKDCKTALDKADTVISAQEDVINTLNGALGSCRESNIALEVQFQKAEEGRRAWYRQPEIVIPGAVVIGLILGVYLAK